MNITLDESTAGPSSPSTSTASSSSLLAARKWRMFGRLGRGRKLPAAKRQETTDSSSESDDGSEDSSSLEEAEENEMDSKDLCVEIKAKEKVR